MDSVTQERVRPLSTQQLGLYMAQPKASPNITPKQIERPVEELPESNWVLSRVRTALEMGYAGVILSGPPGTGKSYFAERIAYTIAGDQSRVRVVQFHASYQYEDFMQGFAPAEDGSGFELQNKVFALVCKEASDNQDVTYVILIDEISRCDVARVFGEALTYLEADKRGRTFQLASGKPLMVPANLLILATMNPWDKGVDELDVALERRFAQIDMPPDADALREILLKKGSDPAFVERVITFFNAVQALDDEMVHLGHAYFNNCINEESASLAWEFRLIHFFSKACRLDKEMLRNIKRLWLKVAPVASDIGTGPATQTTVSAGESGVQEDALQQAAAPNTSS